MIPAAPVPARPRSRGCDDGAMRLENGNLVLGWGYEGRTPGDLVTDARANRVTTVVDVRLTPLSRRPGFSKRSLAATLEASGLAYLHLPALGNPRDNRAGFADLTGADGRIARNRFATEVLGTHAAQDALTQVLAAANAGSVLLLCFEGNESQCHRRTVLDALTSRVQVPVPA